MDNKDHSVTAPETPDAKSESANSSGAAKVTRRSFIAGGLAAVATLFGRKDASAATPPQHMVAGAESVRMEPGAKMADSVIDVRTKDFAARPEMVQDRGSEMANNQLDVHATPPQNMVSGAESVREEPGQKMADSTLDIRDKGSDMANSQLDVQGEPGQKMAADAENIHDRGSDMAQGQERVQKDFAGSAERIHEEDATGGNDASVDSSGETIVEPVIPPQDEAKV